MKLSEVIKAIEDVTIFNPNEIKVDCFFDKASKNGQVTYPHRCQFVKLTHVPSGISVTKENRAQVIAKKEALEELEVLVELWSGDMKGE